MSGVLTVGSLFSGIGGLELGLERAGGFRTIWQAERDPWARAILARHWPGVPCYEDVLDLPRDLERPDVLCGGFPCTDISEAGKRAGIDGPASSLWGRGFVPTIRQLRPRYVLVENVAALARRGLDRVLGDLAALGYDAEWRRIRASDVGAPHLRARLFILAHTPSERGEGRGLPEARRGPTATRADAHGRGEELADGDDQRRLHLEAREHAAEARQHAQRDARAGRREAVGDAERREPERDGGPRILAASRCQDAREARQRERDGHAAGRSSPHEWPPRPGDEAGWRAFLERRPGLEPAIRRGPHGIPRRVDRLRGLGNAVVPQVAQILGYRILELEAGGNGMTEATA